MVMSICDISLEDMSSIHNAINDIVS